MIVQTVELGIDAGREDIERLRGLPGSIGITAHQNVISLYYAQPLGNREKDALTRALGQGVTAGTAVLSVLEYEQDV